jgi:hypothetical protein
MAMLAIVWTGMIRATVDKGYAGPLTNLVEVTTEQGLAGKATAIANAYKVYLPVVMRNSP